MPVQPPSIGKYRLRLTISKLPRKKEVWALHLLWSTLGCYPTGSLFEEGTDLLVYYDVFTQAEVEAIARYAGAICDEAGLDYDTDIWK